MPSPRGEASGGKSWITREEIKLFSRGSRRQNGRAWYTIHHQMLKCSCIAEDRAHDPAVRRKLSHRRTTWGDRAATCAERGDRPGDRADARLDWRRGRVAMRGSRLRPGRHHGRAQSARGCHWPCYRDRHNLGYLEVARASAAANASFEQRDVYNTDLPAKSFDLVHMRFVAGTVGDPERLLREAKRIARPGGIIAMAVQCWRMGRTESAPQHGLIELKRLIRTGIRESANV